MAVLIVFIIFKIAFEKWYLTLWVLWFNIISIFGHFCLASSIETEKVLKYHYTISMVFITILLDVIHLYLIPFEKPASDKTSLLFS